MQLPDFRAPAPHNGEMMTPHIAQKYALWLLQIRSKKRPDDTIPPLMAWINKSVR